MEEVEQGVHLGHSGVEVVPQEHLVVVEAVPQEHLVEGEGEHQVGGQELQLDLKS
jgi:hypothetical protein